VDFDNLQTMTYVPNQNLPLGTTLGGGGHFWEQTLRLTWQASPKNKFGLYYNNKKRQYVNGATTSSHEVLNTTYFFPFSDNLLTWSSPMTNKFLLEAGFWRHQETWGNRLGDTSFADPLAVGGQRHAHEPVLVGRRRQAVEARELAVDVGEAGIEHLAEVALRIESDLLHHSQGLRAHRGTERG